jgi:hypothetical protein
MQADHPVWRAIIVTSVAAVSVANFIAMYRRRCDAIGTCVQPPPILVLAQSVPILFLSLLAVSVVLSVVLRKRLGAYAPAVPVLTLVVLGAIALFV